MYNIELKITKKDWLFIVLAGLLFGFLMSAYFGQLSFNNAIFGSCLGFSISVCALILITFANALILPKIDKTYWIIVAFIFSFLSGFIGTFICESFFNTLNTSTPFSGVTIEFATINGVVTCFIGALLHRFVKMRNENEKISNMLMKSRLNSLETQLNPHFLFNSINSIAELMHKDINLAEDTMLQMSDFLRCVMNEDSIITVDAEIQNIKRYVNLENIRYDNQIEIIIYIVKGLQEFKIPKFSIGLLVENAIKHGKIVNQKLIINIKITEKQNLVFIMVSNNGKDMENLNFGIGLKNLSERLQLLHNATVSFIKNENITYRIELPK
ncbi:MAG: hypothetical protein RL154_522 [Pseudomonadota bacterium]|jgi:sensor histidine kinase YesM